jgi:hypothetical protein
MNRSGIDNYRTLPHATMCSRRWASTEEKARDERSGPDQN